MSLACRISLVLGAVALLALTMGVSPYASTVVAGVAGLSSGGGQVASDPQFVATTDQLDRLGSLAVGDTFVPESAGAAWEGEGKHPETDCEYFDGGSLPAGVAMMVMEGRIARFELGGSEQSRPTRGPFGLFPGITRAQVEASMPTGVQISPHAYGGVDDVYIDWHQPGGRYGVRVEVVGGHADAVFWGDGDAIQLIEGCS